MLIGGYIHKAEDGGKAFCEELIKSIEHRPIKILDCLFARTEDSWPAKLNDDRIFFAKNMLDFQLELASPATFLDQLKNSDVVFFQGGTPHLLMSQLDPNIDWGKELQEKILVGSSGGADTIAKYYAVGKTGNIGQGLGLLPIKFIPHWKSVEYAQEIVIDWEALFEKLQSHKEPLEIVTAGDTEFVVFEK